MPDFTQRVLTFIKVSSSDCLLTRRRLCAGDNAGRSPVGPQRRLTIIRPQENRKVARCSGGGAVVVVSQPGFLPRWWRAGCVGSGEAALSKPGTREWKRSACTALPRNRAVQTQPPESQRPPPGCCHSPAVDLNLLPA